MTTDEVKSIPAVSDQPKTAEPPASLTSIQSLLEKNLKWSQIIYEQNRKINRKLLISSLIGWFYFIIIVVPIVLSIIFLPPLLKGMFSQYKDLLGGFTSGEPSTANIQDIIKKLPLNDAQKQQIGSMLK